MNIKILKNLKLLATVIAVTALSFSLNAQTNIASQSFEGSGNWNYSPNPANYNTSSTSDKDVWDIVSALPVGSSTPSVIPTNGASFWGMQDLNNVNGGGNFYHVLAFEDIDIIGYTNVTLSFDYKTVSYDSTDELRYILVVDGIDQTPVNLPKNNSNTITLNISTNYPAAKDISIRIEALQDGPTDYAGVDNFSIDGTLVNMNDLTSTVNAPTSQIPGNTVNANDINTQLNAVDVFKFEIEDQGTTDNKTTIVTDMKFTPGLNNTLQWGDDVQGITIFDGSNYIIPSNVIIDDSEITLEFNDVSNSIVVADNSSKTFTLAFYINETDIADNDVIQVKIDDFGHGFHEDSAGSGFENSLSGGSIIGNLISVNVEATELRFLQQPTDVNVGEVMSPDVKIAFTDLNGNVDSTYTGSNGTINLITNGSTDSSATLSEAAQSGIATFDDLIFTTQQSNITLTASHGDNIITGTYTSDSFDVIVSLTVLAIQDFENSTPEWLYSSDVTFFDNGTSGFFGFKDISSTPLDYMNLSGNILFENDLDDEGNNGTSGFANITFSPVNIENFNDVTISFDYDIQGYNANDDDAKYQVFYDGIGQGEVFLLDGNSASSVNDAEGTISIIVPNTVDEVYMVLSIRNDGASGYSGFDNFVVTGYPDTPQLFIFEDNIWTPGNPQGISDFNDDITIVNGNAIFNQDLTVRDLTVDNGASVEFQELLDLKGDIVNNGTILFKSISETQTGVLGEVLPSSSISGSGDFVTERYISAGDRAFRFLSSAVTTSTSINENWQEGVNNTGINFPSDNINPNPGYGIHITGSQTGSNGFDATPSGNPSLFTFDNVTQTWSAVGNTNSNTLTAGNPYRVFVRGDRGVNVTDNSTTPTATTIRSTGSIVTGDVTMNNMSGVQDDFNFIGNPYQAPVDMQQLLFSSSTNINTNQYYIWDPNLSSQGAYVTISLIDGTNSQGSNANMFLQPGQAAFVTTASTTANTSLVFQENFKGIPSDLTETFRSSNDNINIVGKLYTQEAFTNNDYINDSFRIRFSNQYSNNKELNDAIKPFNIDENIGLKNGNYLFSIESRELPTNNETIEIYNDNYRSENYVLSLSIGNFDNLSTYLKDDFTGQLILLNPGENNIPFSVDLSDASSNSDRFSLVFENSTLSDEITELDALAIYPNPLNGGSLFIKLPNNTNNELEVNAYNMLGQKIYSETSNTSNSTLEIQNASAWKSGVYLISVSNGNKTITKKIVKK